jgi:hypothetical protein
MPLNVDRVTDFFLVNSLSDFKPMKRFECMDNRTKFENFGDDGFAALRTS